MSRAYPQRVKQRDPTEDEVEGYVLIVILLVQIGFSFIFWRFGYLLAAMK
jgi:hypothetical protein